MGTGKRNYEVVEIKEKKIVGLTARTSNMSPDMGHVIGGLWVQLYQDGVYEMIPDKANNKAVGIYSNYASDESGEYNITVGCEVLHTMDSSQTKTIAENAVYTTIPAGKYAKFEVCGHMQRAVAELWQDIWDIPLDRTYISDFEEYQNCDMENAVIWVYIGIK